MKHFPKIAMLILMSSLPALCQPKVQIALLLDTSGSMDGLIEQAKTRLWNLVNEIALAEKNGVTPTFEVALYEYGKASLPAHTGYISQLSPLTTDLDAVSEALFALRTNGGDEYCGQVIREATRQLNWSREPGDFKAVFIAGNEPFNQGSVSYETWCRKAIGKGIVVNTIFCGRRGEGVRTHWKDGADMADGRFMVIDHNAAVADIDAPQDAQILALGRKLNQTYMGYGERGKKSKMRQQKQDANAAGASKEAAVQRTMAKASKAYNTKKWDLVSAADEGEVDLDDVAEEALPEPMREMTSEEKKAFVAQKSKERKEIQKQIARLKKERADYVAKHTQKNAATLDKAMEKAVVEQMEKRAFVVKK